jgi:pimeloyl-ACP methyl ester carboxylesterase
VPEALLIPGNDLGAGFYRPFTELFPNTECLELPGLHGSAATEPLTWSELTARILRAIQSSRPSTLIGHSLGGLLALLAAARAPHPLQRLVLVEPAILPHRLFATLFARRYTREVVAGDRGQFENDTGFFRRVHDLSTFPPWAIAHYLQVRKANDEAAVARLLASVPDIYPLAPLKLPVLLVMGSSSGRRSHWLSALLRRKLRPAQVVIIENAGHWLFNEQDRRLAEALTRFCEDYPTR